MGTTPGCFHPGYYSCGTGSFGAWPSWPIDSFMTLVFLSVVMKDYLYHLRVLPTLSPAKYLQWKVLSCSPYIMDIWACGREFLFMQQVKLWLLSNGPIVSSAEGLHIETYFHTQRWRRGALFMAWLQYWLASFTMHTMWHVCYQLASYGNILLLILKVL